MTEQPDYWIYMLECENGAFYTGITTNLDRRWSEHCAGAVKYTRSFRPVRVAASWKLHGPMGTALRVERLIKKQSSTAKLKLTQSPKTLRDLISRRLDIDIDVKPSRRRLRA